MRNRTWPVLGTVALVLATSLPVALADSLGGDEASVHVIPSGGTYPVGSEIDVEVSVADVQNLCGADVQLAFDATKLSVVDADPVKPGTQITPLDVLLSTDLVVKREADNDLGVIWYAVTQLNPSKPVTGTGTPFSFTLERLGPGQEVPVNVETAALATGAGAPIPSTTRGARYTIARVITSFCLLWSGMHEPALCQWLPPLVGSVMLQVMVKRGEGLVRIRHPAAHDDPRNCSGRARDGQRLPLILPRRDR